MLVYRSAISFYFTKILLNADHVVFVSDEIYFGNCSAAKWNSGAIACGFASVWVVPSGGRWETMSVGLVGPFESLRKISIAIITNRLNRISWYPFEFNWIKSNGARPFNYVTAKRNDRWNLNQKKSCRTSRELSNDMQHDHI